MKEISKEHLLTLMGGWADPEKCHELEIEASDIDPEDKERWKRWEDDFNRYCLGI